MPVAVLLGRERSAKRNVLLLWLLLLPIFLRGHELGKYSHNSLLEYLELILGSFYDLIYEMESKKRRDMQEKT